MIGTHERGRTAFNRSKQVSAGKAPAARPIDTRTDRGAGERDRARRPHRSAARMAARDRAAALLRELGAEARVGRLTGRSAPCGISGCRAEAAVAKAPPCLVR